MARSRTLSARSVLRAKIVLHRASGESFRDIGQALGCAHRTAWQCLKRWEEAVSRRLVCVTLPRAGADRRAMDFSPGDAAYSAWIPASVAW
jgi:hypothetical protein